MANAQSGSRSSKDYGKDMCCHLCFSMCFSRLYCKSFVLLRFSEAEGIMANLVYLEEDGVDGETEPMDRARKAVWGMLYAG